MEKENEGWPCACVRRGKDGKMTHIRVNSPALSKCNVCGVKRPNDGSAT